MLLNLIISLLLLLNFQNKNHDYAKPKAHKNTYKQFNSSRNVYRDSLKISYIGNMGVLIKSNNQQVLIDGLHKEYKPEYVFPSRSDVQKLIHGNYNENSSIDIALVTHYHKDHFDAKLLKEYLIKNEKSIVIGSRQVTEAINLNLENSKIQHRIKKIPYDNKMHTVTHNDIKIRAFKCPHVNTTRHIAVQNIAYIVDINGHSILHLGDTDLDTAGSSIKNQNLTHEKFDAIVLPYWMLLNKSSKKQILGLSTVGHLIVTHIPPLLSEKVKRTLLSNYNNVILFAVQGKEITL